MRKRESGFTLIELLVVISIIALLLGILIPALSKVKLTAQTLICGTNLKNYGVGLQAYAGDNDEKAPFAVYWLYSRKTLTGVASLSGSSNVASLASSSKTFAKEIPIGGGSSEPVIPQECRWHYDRDEPDGAFWPYVQDKNVHMCPTFRSYAQREGCPHCGAPQNSSIPFNPMYSYAMNYFLGFDWETGLSITFEEAYKHQVSLKLSRVTRPGHCFAFSEENLWAMNQNSDPPYRENYSGAILNDNALWLSPRPSFYTDNVATYHNVNVTQRSEGKANLVFVDGHVETLRGKPENYAYLEYGRPYAGHERLNPLW